jgi:adenine-specific DNA-methyltransferase
MAQPQPELIWIGKDRRSTLEPCLLVHDPVQSYRAADHVGPTDLFDNRLIRGDNLQALQALKQEFTGQIKCVYIDPPYNTGQALAHYDDGLEHSTWLSFMRERLLVLKDLLRHDGTLFCQLNDDEAAYGKVLLDEIFGRHNFINQVSVRMKRTAGASGGGQDKRLKKNVEYLLIYAQDRDGPAGFGSFNAVYDEQDLCEVIRNMQDAGRSWKYTSILLGAEPRVHLATIADGEDQPIEIFKRTNVQRTTVAAMQRQTGKSEEEIYFEHFQAIFSDTNAQSSIRTRVIDAVGKLDEGEMLEVEYKPRSGRDRGQLVTHAYVSNTIRRVIWLRDIACQRGRRLLKLERTGTFWDGFPLNNLTKEGGVRFQHGKKPEALLHKILELATQPGDLVLDAFGGSGTTGAVAHKMGRRWILVELGPQCDTHIIPRLRKVIDGADPGGVTAVTGWQGGGGFRYYRASPCTP